MIRFVIRSVLAVLAAAASGSGATTSYPPYIITFASGAARPDAAAPQILAKVLIGYREGKGASALTVSGHTDRVGSIDANRRLSCARARAVQARLISRGIPADRIFIAGFGETRPAVETRDEVAEPGNRRVEIALVPHPWPHSASASTACR